MIRVRLEKIEEEIAFAKEAAKVFEEHPRLNTYGEIEKDELFAMRWGADKDCVIVFRIANTPHLYGNIVRKQEK